MSGIKDYFTPLTPDQKYAEIQAEFDKYSQEVPTQEEISGLKHDKKIGWYTPIDRCFASQTENPSSQISVEQILKSDSEESESNHSLNSMTPPQGYMPINEQALQDKSDIKKRKAKDDTSIAPKRVHTESSQQVEKIDLRDLKENTPPPSPKKGVVQTAIQPAFFGLIPKITKIDHLDLSLNNVNDFARLIKTADYPIKITFPKPDHMQFQFFTLSPADFKLLSDKGAYLKELDISQMGQLSKGRNADFKEELKKFSNLETLNLFSHKDLTSRAFIEIVKALPKLKTINIGSCNLLIKDLAKIQQELKLRINKGLEIKSSRFKTLEEERNNQTYQKRLNLFSRKNFV